MRSALRIACWCGVLWMGSTLTADEPQKVAGRTVEGWAEELKSDNRIVRLRAAKSLGAFGEAAAKPLVAALESEDAGVRYIAAAHLGRIGGQPLRDAVEPLMEIRQDETQPAVQLAAAFALFKADAGEAELKLLADRLSDPERGMACSAAEFLGWIGPAAEPAIPALEKAYAANKPGGKGDYHVGGAAQNALRKIRGEQ